MNSRKRIKTKNVIITIKEKHCPLKKFANVKEKRQKRNHKEKTTKPIAFWVINLEAAGYMHGRDELSLWAPVFPLADYMQGGGEMSPWALVWPLAHVVAESVLEQASPIFRTVFTDALFIL